MATILDFRQKPAANPKPRGGAPCEVIFFTGVRYERGTAADARRIDQKPDERRTGAQSTLPA
ncbi:MAG: hypothetical protein M9939_02260 [Mesorhizobium sp.]|nr:hypothetical protein [Mesorhizobium sp.]MCO5159932.1 hypothetical protein [Mesorhizobium sp.]